MANEIVYDAEFEVVDEKTIPGAEIPEPPPAQAASKAAVKPRKLDLDSAVEEAKKGRLGGIIGDVEAGIAESKKSGRTGDAMVGEAKTVAKAAWDLLTGEW